MRNTFYIHSLMASLFVLGAFNASAQKQTVKQLKQTYLKTHIDTSKANILNKLGLEYLTINNDTAILYSEEALKISKKTNYINGSVKAYINMANAYRHLDSVKKCLYYIDKIETEKLVIKIPTSLERKTAQAEWLYAKARVCEVLDSFNVAKGLYLQSLKIAEELHNHFLKAKNCIGLKFVAYKTNDIKGVIKYAFNSIPELEIIKDSVELCKSYNYLARSYSQLNEHQKAHSYYLTALSLALKIKKMDLVSLMYCNIGIAFHELSYKDPKYLDSALWYANKSLLVAESIKDVEKEIYALSLIGSCYLNAKQYEKSLPFLRKGLTLANSLKDNYYKISFTDHIGELYQKTERLDSAIYYGKQSLQYSQEVGSKEGVQYAAENLTKTYLLKNDFKSAYEMQSLYYSSRDSILSDENKKELINQELKYNYDKLAIADSLKYENDKKMIEFKNQETLQGEQNKKIILFISLILTIALVLLVFTRFRNSQNKNFIIEKQKKSIEEKTKEVQDSIAYSKEIQNVFLKSIVDNPKYFKNSLLIYKPKDVVSGDFYWYKEINDNLFVVVGDCTGHGVPGAIISVLAIQCLENAVPKIKNHQEIHELNYLIKKDFDNYISENKYVNIGLDFSIICLNHVEQKIYISGSGMSVLLKNKQKQIINEKFQSINIGGATPNLYLEKTASYNFKDVASVFLYSDGVIDQRGGPQNKKFGTRKLIDLLTNLETKDTAETLEKIEKTIDQWKSHQSQIDDITLLGFQIS